MKKQSQMRTATGGFIVAVMAALVWAPPSAAQQQSPWAAPTGIVPRVGLASDGTHPVLFKNGLLSPAPESKHSHIDAPPTILTSVEDSRSALRAPSNRRLPVGHQEDTAFSTQVRIPLGHLLGGRLRLDGFYQEFLNNRIRLGLAQADDPGRIGPGMPALRPGARYGLTLSLHRPLARIAAHSQGNKDKSHKGEDR